MLWKHRPQCLGISAVGWKSLARYSVHWTVGHVRKHGANFDLIVGKWGGSATASDRCAVSLAYRLIKGAPQFMVIDPANGDVAGSHLVGRALARAEVVGQPLAQEIFALCDARPSMPGVGHTLR